MADIYYITMLIKLSGIKMSNNVHKINKFPKIKVKEFQQKIQTFFYFHLFF